MAQHDTGLGWSAKSDWLVSVSGTVGSIGGITSDIPGDSPLPTSEYVFADISLRGLLIYDNADIHWRKYAAGAIGTIFYGFYVEQDTNNYSFIAVTDTIENHLYSCMVGVGFTWDDLATTTEPAFPNLYYVRITNIPKIYALSDIPAYNTVAEGLAHYSIVSQTVYKLNAGYAVVCWAKWTPPGGSALISPIAISSDRNAVDLSLDNVDPAPYQAVSYFMEDGIKFYMSIIQNIPNGSISTALNNVDISSVPKALEGVFRVLASSDYANIVVEETVDPYEDFGNTGEDAGEINPNPQDDDIDFDDLPTVSFSTAGFCRIFNPDISDLNDLASYMWTDQTFLQTVINHLKQLLDNPMEAIISLCLVPVHPPATTNKVPVKVMFFPTGVSMRQVTNQFVSVDCGTTVLQESFGGALDYNPYTRVSVYLPYVGIVQLDTDEVMSKTLHLKYNIDVVTGICCAEIKADNKLLYSFSGHCAVSQPITSADFSSYLNAAIAAAKLAVGVATGTAATTAAAAASEGPAIPPSSQTANTSQVLVPVPSGQPIGPYLGSPPSRRPLNIPDIPSSGGDSKPAMWGELLKPGNINTVAAAMGGKMVVQHSGGFSGNSGYLAKRRPYLIVVRPRIANPKEYSQHFGRTSMEYLNLGSCTGYTKIESVHLTGFDATNPELSEISSLLKGGVIF